MPKIEIENLPWRSGSGYPEAYRALVEGRRRKRLGDAVELTQFGVNLTRLQPGSATAQRHWHAAEDEFVFVLEGEVTLIEDDGERTLGPGEAAGFKAGVPNGHHLVNRSGAEVLLLEIGSRAPRETAEYPDIDLRVDVEGQSSRYTHKDGTPY